MNKVQLTAEARADLLEIWVYYANTGLDLADQVVSEITEAFDLMESFPSIGRARDDLGKGRRSYAVAPYVIVYHRKDDSIAVERVLHGARDFSLVFPADDLDES